MKNMIQDIEPHIYHNEYTPVPPSADSFLMICRGRNILLKEENGAITFPRLREAEPAIQDMDGVTYLFTIDGDRFYLPPEGS